jgi:amino acid adenylation domain-containing protein
VVEELAPERDLGRTPLFQVMLVLQNARAAVARLPGLTLSPVELETEAAKFDLTLSFAEAADGLAGALEYSADLFDGATARRLAGHLEVLLAAAAGDPGRRLSELPLLTAPERAQVLGGWRGERTAYPREATLHELFAEQAARGPEATALVTPGRDEERLTYGELAARAGRLAHLLRAHGVGPEMVVAVLLERSPELVVCLLGILAAGGAYLPLDPTSPAERLALVIADAGSPLVLTREDLAGRLPATVAENATVLALDRPPVAASLEGAPPAVGAGPDGLAYVMYTSGSTGVPKGVAVPHRAVVRLVLGTGYMDFGPDQVFAQLAPASFDASTLEIWGALLHGGRLVVPPPGAQSLDELGTLLESAGVSALWLTAGLFHQMVEEAVERLRPVRQLLAGGDVLSPAHVEKALRALPGTRLINGYGPTENTTFTCCHPIDGPPRPGETVPIGRPIANTEVLLLDRAGQPAPVGVPAELCAGGDGLARGYLGRPDLTAAAFVPHPFGRAGGERLYRTGDLARWRPDGAIEFLGRLDDQVKVRGFRIEPGEVEAALARHPAVAECAVLARRDRSEARLVAYVVARPGVEAAAPALRAFLAERLPASMLPWAFVALPALPLTANGKVDRRALPAPERQGAPGAAHVAPRTAVEEVLAGLWGEVLELDRVGVHDDFFALGGHSLLATRIVSRVAGTFQVEVPLRRLFEKPTVAELAAAVIEHESRPGQSEKIARALLRLEALSPQARRSLRRQPPAEGSLAKRRRRG